MKVLVLAGGEGQRLWPLSRFDFPKQFIQLKTACNKTYPRDTKELHNIPLLIKVIETPADGESPADNKIVDFIQMKGKVIATEPIIQKLNNEKQKKMTGRQSVSDIAPPWAQKQEEAIKKVATVIAEADVDEADVAEDDIDEIPF